MKTIRIYLFAFLVTSCMFATLPTQAINFDLISMSRNHYISAAIVVGVLAGSYLCFKHFWDNRSTSEPIADQDVKLIIKQQIELPVNQDIVLQEKLGDSLEATKSQQASTVTSSVIDSSKVMRFIEVMNDHEQSLNIYVSNDDDSVQQFSISGYSYKQIHLN